MPDVLQFPLAVAAVWATFFLLAWALARESLSPRARVLGWLSVAVTAAAFFWSVWVESLAPYVAAGRSASAWRAALQVAGALVGVGITFAGGVRFLRAWLRMDWVVADAQRGADAADPFRDVRTTPNARARWRKAAALMVRLLRLPGLGWVPAGVGLAVLALQCLEPDPSMPPDPALVAVAVVALAVGGLQGWWAARAR